jgi:hypothetical protein
VLELQERGVKRLPPKRIEGLPGFRREPARLGPEPRAIDLVAEKRVLHKCEMNPDLVRPAGFQFAAQETC